MGFVSTQKSWKKRDEDVIYYNVLKDIIELDYWVDKIVTLFKYDWVHSSKGVKVDSLGFNLVETRMRMTHSFLLYKYSKCFTSKTQQMMDGM